MRSIHFTYLGMREKIKIVTGGNSLKNNRARERERETARKVPIKCSSIGINRYYDIEPKCHKKALSILSVKGLE